MKRKSLPKFRPFVVFELFQDGPRWVVGQDDGFFVGMPQIYETREQARRRAAELNRMHGIRQAQVNSMVTDEGEKA